MSNYFRPIGNNQRFIIICNGQPFNGAETLEAARALVNHYKQPGDPKRKSAQSCQSANWSILDTITQTTFTA
jgi:hypothetical protein